MCSRRRGDAARPSSRAARGAALGRTARADRRLASPSVDLSEIGGTVVGEDELQARISELGKDITADYEGRPPLLVGVLKGAFVFMSDLSRAIDLPVEFDFMAVSSYGSATRSSGVVRILKDARRHSLVALLPVNLPIFVLAGEFNLWYNATYYVPQLRKLDAGHKIEDAFWFSTVPINGILYSLGTFLVLYSAMPVAQTLGRLSRGEKVEADALVAARRRAIVLGHCVAVVGLGLWLVAGLVFPLFIHGMQGTFPRRATCTFSSRCWPAASSRVAFRFWPPRG